LIIRPARGFPANIKALLFGELNSGAFVDNPLLASDPLWESQFGPENEVDDIIQEIRLQLQEVHGIDPDSFTLSITKDVSANP
jgi:hypothetical protein